MTVSKRLRYEILRRDNHTCRYCGGVAPDVVLTVDHVIATALGGTDDPGNLVAACKDCNSGKSATPAGAQLLDTVSDDAFRWAAAMREAFDLRLAQIEQRDQYRADFLNHWEGWTYGPDNKTVELPADWERSVTKWYGLGLPHKILRDAIDTAMRKRGLTGYDPEFRYMAGVVWSTITELEQQVAATLAAPASGRAAHCESAACMVHDPELNWACPRCGQERCQWHCGYRAGETDGWDRVHGECGYEIYQATVLAAVCDRGGWTEPAF